MAHGFTPGHFESILRDGDYDSFLKYTKEFDGNLYHPVQVYLKSNATPWLLLTQDAKDIDINQGRLRILREITSRSDWIRSVSFLEDIEAYPLKQKVQIVEALNDIPIRTPTVETLIPTNIPNKQKLLFLSCLAISENEAARKRALDEIDSATLSNYIFDNYRNQFLRNQKKAFDYYLETLAADDILKILKSDNLNKGTAEAIVRHILSLEGKIKPKWMMLYDPGDPENIFYKLAKKGYLADIPLEYIQNLAIHHRNRMGNPYEVMIQADTFALRLHSSAREELINKVIELLPDIYFNDLQIAEIMNNYLQKLSSFSIYKIMQKRSSSKAEKFAKNFLLDLLSENKKFQGDWSPQVDAIFKNYPNISFDQSDLNRIFLTDYRFNSVKELLKSQEIKARINQTLRSSSEFRREFWNFHIENCLASKPRFCIFKEKKTSFYHYKTLLDELFEIDPQLHSSIRQILTAMKAELLHDQPYRFSSDFTIQGRKIKARLARINQIQKLLEAYELEFLGSDIADEIKKLRCKIYERIRK